MCGIAGKVWFDDGARVSRELLERMSATLVHRGPDESDLRLLPPAGLAHRRLAIIDLETGRQPLANEEGTVWAMLNGEIYNYVELRQELASRGHELRTNGDAEVIVHLYEELGERFVQRLRGMFAIALWDTQRRALVLARDRLGKKPLFFARLGGRGIVFASEIKALLADPDVDGSVDPHAIDAYLSLQYVPAPRTAFRGIEKLPPAHLLTASDGRVALEEYWRVHPAPGSKRVEAADWRRELETRLGEAVRLRLRSDVPVGAFLSGGIDSSAVVSFMAEQSPGEVVACSVGFEDPQHDELEHARRVARYLDCHLHEHVVELEVEEILPRVVRHFDEPFADPAAIPTWALAREARRHVKVALSGDGGDELFAGYWRHQALLRERRIRGIFGRRLLRGAVNLAAPVVPSWKRQGFRRLGMDDDQAYAWMHAGIFFDHSVKRALYTPGMAASCAGSDPSAHLREQYRSSSAGDALGRALTVDLTTYLPDDLLVKLDRMTMAHGLEVRSPFLDHHVVELAAAIPSELKLAGRRGKVLLTEMLTGRLPPEILKRPKHGFTAPVARWLRGPLREMTEDCLRSPRARERGLFEAALVERQWSRFVVGDDHLADRIWMLLLLELWHRGCVDGR